MRLLTVLLSVITITYAKKTNRRLKTAKPVNRDVAALERLVEKGDIEESHRYLPVPYGHIYKEGLDPLAPIDFLDLSSYYVKDHPLLRQLLPQQLAIPLEKPKGFVSPKDAFYFGPKEGSEETETKQPSDDTIIFDFAGLLNRNINMNKNKYRNPSLQQLVAKRREEELKNISLNIDVPPNLEKKLEDNFMAFNTFEFEIQRKKNWTTCKEFGKKPDFNPNDIEDLEWVPFFIWADPDNTMNSAQVHFTYPTKRLVKYYKEKMPHLNKSVDWEQPKLLLKESMEFLLIAIDRRGLFHAIPRNEIPEELHTMMMCDYKYAVIMANPGNEPDTDEDKAAEAKTLKFKDIGNSVERNLEYKQLVAIETQKQF